jgi:hypothetical protein
MFFRREKLHVDTFQERIEALKKYGFDTKPEGSGSVRVMRNGIGAVINDVANAAPQVQKAGFVVGSETGVLVNAGYQQFWLMPSKLKVPAQASQLKELHEFEEDMKEALGLSSLYNTSLGTISALHLYDRLEERDDSQAVRKPWEIRLPTP